jgi:pilus assembly protein TadC
MAIKISTQFIRKKKELPHKFYFVFYLLFYNVTFYAGIFKKWVEEAWSGLLWLRIGTGS